MYVDPGSKSILELGTRLHPYKSLQPAFVELLNHYSNRNTSVMIYLKENSKLYLQDGTNHILNITNVTITSYSDTSDVPSRATIVPTQIPQPTTGRTVLHLLNNYDLKLDEVIAEGNYTDSEILLLDNSQVTFQILRSSVLIDNVNVERQPIDLLKNTLLINLIYLQDKVMSMTNMDINITGTLMNSADPFNGLFEHITIDAYGLLSGFFIFQTCNYPEASLQNEVVFNYIKVIMSSDRTLAINPNIVFYQGSGNATLTNSDYVDFYSTVTNIRATNLFLKDGACQPDDDLLQTFTFDNTTLSLVDNNFIGERTTANAMVLTTNLYRNVEGYVKNDHYINFESPAFIILYLEGEANSNIFVTNSEFINFTAGIQIPIWIQKFGNVYIEEIMVDNITSLSTPLFYFDVNTDNVTLKGITVTNVTGTSSGQGDVFLFNNLQTTETVIEELYASDMHLNSKQIIGSAASLDTIQIRHCVFENIHTDSSNYLVRTGNIKSLQFINNTISGMRLTDSTNTDGAFLTISTLDLDSVLDTVIQDISVHDSELSLIVFGTLINTPVSDKLISFTNINFTDSYFDSNRALFSTDGIQLDSNVQFSFSNLLFSNISFSTVGTLIECKQQLPTYLTITDSHFVDLTAALILIESSNTQDSNLETLVQINDTVFDNINDKFNSFISINQGSQLEINNCSFTNIVSYRDGAVIKAGARQTVTLISDTSFVNNSAIQGGVLSVQEESVIK